MTRHPQDNPHARLQVVTPCDDHRRYEAHGDCQGPAFTMLLEYDGLLATVDCGDLVVPITAEHVIHAAFAALPEYTKDTDTE